MTRFEAWTKHLGYDQVPGALIGDASAVRPDHPFATEVSAMFDAAGDIGATGVLCIDRVPTVCLIDAAHLAGDNEARSAQVRRFCERLWNQNLARIVLVAEDEALEAWSVDDPKAACERLTSADAAFADFSLYGLLSGKVLKDRPSWFDPKKRVDKTLLDNVDALVGRLSGFMPAALARDVTATVIFVAYLEDRGIVTDEYRWSRNIRPLNELLKRADAIGLERLFEQLQDDFNGDFLAPDEGRGLAWSGFSTEVFSRLHQFLQRTVLRSGQQDFWRYNFAEIPIELIAGIYETFLGQESNGLGVDAGLDAKRRHGAYYTPRLLSDWVAEQALDGLAPLEQRIFDGACGSGMLLTAAFRRLMRAQRAVAEARGEGEAGYNFSARSQLLRDHIFGGDIDEDARRLTAFSLYLALLSELPPRDLEILRRGGHKLPSLKENIRGGSERGNFFSASNENANRGRYTVVLSNPPWRQLTNSDPETKVVESWAKRQPTAVHWPNRQIAAAFALGAAESLAPGGRFAMLLPIGLFISAEPSIRRFRANLLSRYRIERITNFADMRRLIFVDADHPFVVVVASRRTDLPGDLIGERFEYWTPKTDIALSFGRLTLHGADRAMLSASALIDEKPHLRLRYWGSLQDLDLLERLWQHGSVNDLRAKHGWVKGKGFHHIDNDARVPIHRRTVVPSNWLREHRFLKAKGVPSDLPIVDAANLESFPFDTIAREPEELRRFFTGPRVIWPDGTHPENGVKAVFTDEPFSFQHSIGVLSAPDTEEGRLEAKLLATYMRSSMGIWLSLLLSPSVAAERPKLHVTELLTWPYWPISDHPSPKKARAIARKVSLLFEEVQKAEPLSRRARYDGLRSTFDGLIFEYFDLRVEDCILIQELAHYAGPSLQPSSLSYEALVKSMRRPPTADQITAYCRRLVSVLSQWRDTTGGKGELTASARTACSVPIGGIVVTLSGSKTAKPAAQRIDDDSIVSELLGTVARAVDSSPERFLTLPDIITVQDKSITIVKPLVTRFWLERAAIEDANRLVAEIGVIRRSKNAA